MRIIFKDTNKGCVWLDDTEPGIGLYAPRKDTGFWPVEEYSGKLCDLLRKASSNNFGGQKTEELAGQISSELQTILEKHFRSGAKDCQIEITDDFAVSLGLTQPKTKIAVTDWIKRFLPIK